MAGFDFAATLRDDNSSGQDREQAGGQSGASGSDGSGKPFSFSIGDGGEQASNGGNGTSGAQASDGIAKKRRGRQPYPRDAEGRIIRPDGTTGPKTANKSGKAGLDLKPPPNNREALKNQMVGIYALAATITKQEVLLLSEQEAALQTNALADVLDHLGWNVTGGGEAPFIVKLGMLAVTVYTINMPKLELIARMQQATNVTPAKASNAAEARFSPNGEWRQGPIDFSADVAATSEAVNNGTFKTN